MFIRQIKVLPELAGAAVVSWEAVAAGVGVGLEAPKVKVDEVLEAVVVDGADAPKENVDGNDGAVVAGVEVAGFTDSKT